MYVLNESRGRFHVLVELVELHSLPVPVPIHTYQNIMSARSREIYLKWREIQDIIGDASEWPHRIRRLFWTTNIRNFERLLVAAFSYVNGLHPDILMNWASLMNLCRDQAAVRHFAYLFRAFDNKKYQKYYAWNVTTRRYEHVDGSFHQNIKKL